MGSFTVCGLHGDVSEGVLWVSCVISENGGNGAVILMQLPHTFIPLEC